MYKENSNALLSTSKIAQRSGAHQLLLVFGFRSLEGLIGREIDCEKRGLGAAGSEEIRLVAMQSSGQLAEWSGRCEQSSGQLAEWSG